MGGGLAGTSPCGPGWDPFGECQVLPTSRAQQRLKDPRGQGLPRVSVVSRAQGPGELQQHPKVGRGAAWDGDVGGRKPLSFVSPWLPSPRILAPLPAV